MATGLRVLIVEDNRDAADSLAVLLRCWGHEVEVVADGAACLEKLPTVRPDVVVLDIGLPGMDGWEVARRIRAQSQDNAPCLIVISGYGREEDVQRSEAEGITLHFRKPVEPDTLEQLLKDCEKQIHGEA